MHPDEATDAIVDLALLHSRAFAIVPCCVFPKTNPHRRLDGKEVRSLRQLLDYIKSKDPRIQEKELEFSGRNVLLYFHPTRLGPKPRPSPATGAGPDTGVP
ncbi:hypothetical protein T484DRAFT_3045347 [Baffinella frigidus]|nr:hypothetical protein T484DRAFT_3045347 [Cryptophyta sp. CCMP2293]